MAVVVEQVPAGAVLRLRQSVLRPDGTLEDARFEGDESGIHFAAFEPGRAIVGVATILPRPDPADGEPAWQLRGMATEESWRGRGVGRALVEAVLAQVEAEGSARCWCNARIAAVGFYERLGFSIHGERFEIPGVGPHLVMHRDVSSVPLDPRPRFLGR